MSVSEALVLVLTAVKSKSTDETQLLTWKEKKKRRRKDENNITQMMASSRKSQAMDACLSWRWGR